MSWAISGLVLLVSGCQQGGAPLSPEQLAGVREQISRGEFSEARRWLVQQPGLMEAGEEGTYLLGVCEHCLGRPGQAIHAWETVPPSSPFFVKAKLAIGQTLAGNFGRWSQAEEVFRAIKDRAEPEAVVARHALFQLCFFEGRQSEMRRLIEEAWVRLPDRVQELKDHWRIDHVTPDREAIRSAVESASAKAPEDDRVRLARAYLDTLEGRFDEAGKWLEACLKSRPDDPAVWEMALRTARQSGDPDQVKRALSRLDPDEPETLEARAWLAERSGDPERASKALHEALESGSSGAGILGRLVVVEQRRGRNADALRDRLRQVQAAEVQYREWIDSAHPEQHVEELANIAERLGRRFEALAWTTLALERKPGDSDLLKRLQQLREDPGT